MLKEYASNYKGQKVGFIGMGVSNLPVIKLFASNGAECTVRDKNGELWLWTGGKASIRDGNDLTSSTARIKFKAGTDVNLNTSSDSEDIKYFNVFPDPRTDPGSEEEAQPVRYLHHP